MATEWRQSTWGDEISLEYGKALRGRDTSSGAYRVYGSNGAIGWTDQPLAAGPGVVLGRKGAYRGVEYSPNPFFVIDTAYYVVSKHEHDMRWLYYAIKHHKLGEIDDGSPIPSTTRAAVYPREVEVPPITEQRAVAHILGTLDDKIELNRRMSATLEAMARAIFQDWFVAFGPTRAKMEGRPPYLAPDLWSLFPDRLDAEGKPEGWVSATLGDVAASEARSCLPDQIAAGTPYIALEHMPRGQIALGEWGTADHVESGKLRFQRGEFLFGKLRPYFQKVGLAPVDGVCSTDAVVIRSTAPALSAFVLMTISSFEFVDFTDRGSTGTKMPRTSWSQMQRYPLTTPNIRAAEAFQALAGPMLNKIIANVHEGRTLSALRDALLPKLISGELRVRDAERLLERVT